MSISWKDLPEKYVLESLSEKLDWLISARPEMIIFPDLFVGRKNYGHFFTMG